MLFYFLDFKKFRLNGSLFWNSGFTGFSGNFSQEITAPFVPASEFSDFFLFEWKVPPISLRPCLYGYTLFETSDTLYVASHFQPRHTSSVIICIFLFDVYSWCLRTSSYRSWQNVSFMKWSVGGLNFTAVGSKISWHLKWRKTSLR